MKERDIRKDEDKPKVIYLPQKPEEIEAEKARRHRKKK